MAIKAKPKTANLISVHREVKRLFFSVPNVHPGTYYLPGIETPEEGDDSIRACVFSFPGEKPYRYAQKRTFADGRPYVLITVREPKTIITSTGEQKVDEYGQKLFPDVQRFRMDIPPEELANEIERVYGNMGILAIEGDEPDLSEMNEVHQNRQNWMFSVIQDTNKWYKRLGEGLVTDLARNIAHELNVAKLLHPLPEWASLNPSGKAKLDSFNCKGCGTVLPNTIVKCIACGAIYDWKLAVDLGIVKMSDVPPAKLAELGLVPSTSIPDTQESRQTTA